MLFLRFRWCRSFSSRFATTPDVAPTIPPLGQDAVFPTSSVAGFLDFDLFDRLLKTGLHAPRRLRQIHAILVAAGFLHNPHLGALLILGYANLGFLDRAGFVFGEINGRNSFLWNTMARVYAKAGLVGEALQLYVSMRREGILPNNYTYPFVLKASTSAPTMSVGRCVHCDITKTGFGSDVFVAAALVDMYAKRGEIDLGRKLFDGMPLRDLVSWTTMITAYEQSDKPEESLLLFRRMQEEEGLAADRITAISVASAVAQLGGAAAKILARSFHAHAVRNDLLDQDVDVENAVIAMYAKCDAVRQARLVFDAMKGRDGISWNTMLSGYAQNGYASEALDLFRQMLVFGRPHLNMVTLLIVVSACSHLGSLGVARQIHRRFVVISSNNTEEEIGMLRNATIDMYAKCGDLGSALGMFDEYSSGSSSGSWRRDLNSWNVMISGYGIHGRGREALKLFQDMCAQGVRPDHITLTSLLSACSHAGLVDEGKQVFGRMEEEFMVTPVSKHYACMVDMLGRAGRLEEARDLIAGMPIEPNDAVWGALLGACRIHGSRELGEYAAGNLFDQEPPVQYSAGYYVLMSNVYAASTKWEEVGEVRRVMKMRGLRKSSAFSVIEMEKGEVHGFHTADRSHPDHVEVYRKAEMLAEEAKAAAGYSPDVSCVLHDVEEEDKERALCLHSEKLAVAYGVERLPPGLPVVVTKNLRICNDCHSMFKSLTRIRRRKIVVRDANRFHHFCQGECSCGDYW